ncbi:MAG TPA: glycoside hydrolase [Polyangiaceae bacterium]|jgi:O-glycosyl hydrolase|nr:glycoside hydrolase [Polyangiaceae bacterium]
MKSQLLALGATALLTALSSCSQGSSTSAQGGATSAGSGGGNGGGAGVTGVGGSSGGTSSSGGVSVTGGTPNVSGGSSALGGTTATGGISGVGGADISGGGANVAGASGGIGTGGISASGGKSGATGGGGGVSASGGSAGAARGGGGGATSGGSTTSGGAGGARPTVTASPGTTLVKVNVNTKRQTFEGWGTSLCWWANHVGGWSASARNAVVDAVVNPTSGLGYNIFRYNIGGGENPDHEHMGEYREMPGFQPSAGTWNWDADANQRAILQQIVKSGTGVILEAFSNSPPYWMTKSGCAAGSSDGSNNLKDDQYDAFADYLTEVVKHYKDTFGITFRTLEPLNEPNANWWKLNNNQEGCHFSPANQETIIKAVAAKLSAKGLTGTTVSASDENSMDDAYNNMRTFGTATLAAMSQMNVHSYAGSKRTDLRTLATSKAKRLWQSESGPLSQTLADDAEAALFMAGRIIADLRDLQAEAWIDWQVGDPSRNWASFTLNDTQQSFAPLKRFYMHAGFSRYIRPGATFVDVNNVDMVAALSPDGRSLTLVVRNGDTAASKGFTFDLTTLPNVGTMIEVHRTSRTENLASVASAAVQNFSFVATVPAYSVTTFVVPIP